ncbi:MAG: VWA domain-containing protein [Chloroflexi bacterium]|nr:VWA domain-containing protein [Chloroflexota bacterium]
MPLWYSYSRWDGAQSALEIDEQAFLDEFSESLLTKSDVSAALRSMAQRGVRTRQGERIKGVQDLLQQLRGQRQRTLSQHNLDSVLSDIRNKLDELLRTERDGIEQRVREAREQAGGAKESGTGVSPEMARQLLQRLEEMAARKREFLDGLPADIGGAVRQLNAYEFMHAGAQQQFQELKRMLQQEFIARQFQKMAQGMQDLSPESLDGLRQMLHDLNNLLREKLLDGQPDFQGFMEKWGRAFGDQRPQDLDEIIELLKEQIGQIQSLFDSMSPQQRRELESLSQALLDDPGLREELSDLAQNLEAMSPTGRLGKPYPFQGDDPLTLQEALEVMDQLRSLDDLETQLKKTQQGGSLQDIDVNALRSLLGEEAAHAVEQLRQLVEILEKAGYIKQVGSRYELTPRGMRRIGQKALGEMFAYIKRERAGRHLTAESGRGSGDPSGETKSYEFGDQFLVDLPRTVYNAVTRGEEVPVHLAPEDFEVYRTEETSQAATVLMLDLSLSMAMRGNFLAAKKVALALDNLIRTQFFRDDLHIVGFSTYAREVKPEKLPYLSWDEFDPYTNIQHGLALAQKLLSRHKGGTKQIIIISDGEPTAHMEGGQLFLQYPPSPRTIRETLKEVKRATDARIVINTFMLERNSYLVEFVEEMTRINRGRVFYTTPEHLGEYILVDYISNRRRKVIS